MTIKLSNKLNMKLSNKFESNYQQLTFKRRVN